MPVAQIAEEACREAELYKKAGIVRVNVSVAILLRSKSCDLRL